MANDIKSMTHNSDDFLTKNQITEEIAAIKNRLSKQYAAEPDKKNKLFTMLDQLSDFELGRFLIKNKGFSGYWTWYLILGFRNEKITSPLESFLLEKSPGVLATRERFYIFQDLLIKNIRSNNSVCSIPCGMMADLLTLNLSDHIKNVRFVGIDLDQTSIALAKNLSEQLKSPYACEFIQKDAWKLELESQFDIITTNGLNIYEKDEQRVVALYQNLYRALKKNGILICSAFTFPPGFDQICEWNIDSINQHDVQTANDVFKNILQGAWANFRTSATTCNQLKAAGFSDVEIIWDTRKIYPSFCAYKR